MVGLERGVGCCVGRAVDCVFAACLTGVNIVFDVEAMLSRIMLFETESLRALLATQKYSKWSVAHGQRCRLSLTMLKDS